MKGWLEDNGYFVIGFRYNRTACREIEDGLKYDVAIIDYGVDNSGFGGGGGEDVLLTSKHVHPKTPVITYSGYDFKPPKSDYHVPKYKVDQFKLLSRVLGTFLKDIKTGHN